jgi:quercetin dioxygenase-like cupin family protein
MDQLEKGLQYSLPIEERKAITMRIEEILETWGIVLPVNVEPLVFDFGSADFFSIGETEYWIVNEVEHGYCAKYLFLFQNQRCPVHRHLSKHETFYVVKGRINLSVEHEDYVISEGEKKAVEPGMFHGFSAEEPTLILEVSMPSIIGDNEFRDAALGYFDT